MAHRRNRVSGALYVNGIKGGGTLTQAGIHEGSSKLLIGARQSGGTGSEFEAVGCKIDEVRVTKGAARYEDAVVTPLPVGWPRHARAAPPAAGRRTIIMGIAM